MTSSQVHIQATVQTGLLPEYSREPLPGVRVLVEGSGEEGALAPLEEEGWFSAWLLEGKEAAGFAFGWLLPHWFDSLEPFTTELASSVKWGKHIFILSKNIRGADRVLGIDLGSRERAVNKPKSLPEGVPSHAGDAAHKQICG